MKNIILLAVQGAGKGTIAEALEKKYGYVHISTGDILRERAAVGDKFGLEIKELIDKGIFAPDEIIFEAIEHRITQDDCNKGYILDGFPRSLVQAQKYDEILNRLGKDLGVVINLEIPKEALIERITTRRVCKDCGKIYSTSFVQMMPKVENICDDCDGNLIFRDDDQDTLAIEKRINTYHENIKDIINYYEKQNVLYIVDSTESTKAIEEIEKVII